MLIVTGPQGSGNHVFSKVLSLNKNVYGWQELLNQQWIAHCHEPYNACWDDPRLLKNIVWDYLGFYVTSISCPYVKNGDLCIPKYKEFTSMLSEIGINYKLLIIGRDQTILKHQQERVRGRHSYPDFEAELDVLIKLNPIFVSQELLYLYKEKYIDSLSKLLDFPLETDSVKINQILQVDANKKYINQVEKQPLDYIVRSVSGLSNNEK